ncbi:YCF48-related protein [Pseudomonas guariconensis]|uniref:WD40/YVTN/BNR-like repeat-containing protein n=1 Tax=Pseudomonas TaxID=286 RepID=UPI001CE480C5|nr:MULTISPECIES: YCF48-related protein [Pseudomonas]MCO7636386.1 YCF48-related protein [Pseudomonas sp. S 311-6]MCO7516030.1 YCF48-related protein [Pseudomonas putida]MCO7563771.1 YCF48-related protein [Pseudomonas mosselii]MCO7594124.1 YCF48-related protein [Pseudomonas guariconensis]MCO7606736.1 YCF48-related protein [Pseudomonas guariconensis]
MRERLMADARRGAWSLAAGAMLALALGTWAGSVGAAAAEAYSTESAKASQSLLIDTTHAGKRLVVVGDRGHILFSDDQGKTWTQARVPTRQLLTAVFFLDDKRGWAVGHDAQILASNDGGATWSKQFEDLAREAPLLDVWFLDARHGFAVGAYGALLETTDGGQHWQDVAERLDNPDQLHLNGIARVKDAGLFIVGEQGSMFRSSDDGQTWSTVESPYEGSLFGVIGTAQPRTLLAYGLRGNLLRSSDFGDSWQSIDVEAARGPLEFGLASATLLDDGSLVLVGNGGSVLRSHDDGQTFTVYNRADRIALAGVSGLADGRLLLVGQGGVHLATAEGAEEVQP